MALIRFGGGIVGMSGSIAGDTFARNRFGSYNRARTKPINPNTARQQTVRNSLALLSTRWAQTLTSAQRTAWNLYASSVAMKNRLGESIYLTGFNHYLRSNIPLVQNSLTVVDAGPTTFELPEKDPTFAIAAAESTQTITYTFDDALGWANEVGGYLLKYQGKPQNPQRNFFAGPWRLHGIITGAGTPPTTPDPETSPPFAFAQYQRQWCYGRIIRADGRLSEVFSANCFCGA